MTKVSILVAVYNTEKYLSACLDSLLRQTMSDLQIICVDDASTDSSLSILHRYAALDSRIEVISLSENLGQAKARNYALKIARGEWTIMVDSDDYLADNALEQILLSAKQHPKASAIMFELVQVWPNGVNEVYQLRPYKETYSGDEAFRLSLNWCIHGLYAVKTSLHKKYPFDDTCRLYSDDNTTHVHYLHSGEVCTSKAIYYYRKHPNSCTSSVNFYRFDYLEANLSMKRTLMAENADQSSINFYEYHRWLNFIGCYDFYFNHRNSFTAVQKDNILHRLEKTLKTFEKSQLPFHKYLKLGYYPFRSFTAFRFQEEIYFRLRKMLKNH